MDGMWRQFGFPDDLPFRPVLKSINALEAALSERYFLAQVVYDNREYDEAEHMEVISSRLGANLFTAMETNRSLYNMFNMIVIEQGDYKSLYILGMPAFSLHYRPADFSDHYPFRYMFQTSWATGMYDKINPCYLFMGSRYSYTVRWEYRIDEAFAGLEEIDDIVSRTVPQVSHAFMTSDYQSTHWVISCREQERLETAYKFSFVGDVRKARLRDWTRRIHFFLNHVRHYSYDAADGGTTECEKQITRDLFGEISFSLDGALGEGAQVEWKYNAATERKDIADILLTKRMPYYDICSFGQIAVLVDASNLLKFYDPPSK